MTPAIEVRPERPERAERPERRARAAKGPKPAKGDPSALPFRRERLLAAGLLALFAPLPLAFSFALEPRTVVVYVLLLGALLLAVRSGRILSLPDWVLNVAGLALFPLFFLDLRYGVRSLMTATLHVLLATALLRFASVRRERDFSTLLVLSSFLFLGSVATSFHVGILPFVLAYSLAAWTVLARWSLWRELSGVPAEMARDPRAGLLPGRLATAGAVVACSLLAVPFFVLLPRLKAPVVQGPGAGRDVLTGFSESVDPGVTGRMKLSDKVYLRVETGEELREGEVPDLRFRALAFSTWTGKTWTRPAGPARPLGAAAEGFVGLVPGRSRVAGRASKTVIDLTPLGSRYLPVPDRGVSLRLTSLPFRMIGSWLERDSNGNVRLPAEPDRTVQYEVLRSSLPVPDLEAPGEEDPVRRPPGRPALLAFLGEAGVTDRTDPFEVARRLESALATRFTYALDAPFEGESPVEDFLFRRRRGHCESFATAMALVLREAGIPARCVTGFVGGEAGLFGRYILVRGRNAHAWVEAWCGKGRGWVTFDPTPAVGRPGFEQVSPLQQLRNAADGVEFLYDRYVLSFGQADQAELAQRLKEAAGKGFEETGRLAAGFVRGRGPAVILAALAAVVVFFLGRAGGKLLGRRRKGLSLVRGLPPGAETYRRLQRWLRRRGAPLTDASSPAETARAARSHGPRSAEAAESIVRAYVDESFGGLPQGAEAGRRLQELFRAVRREARPAAASRPASPPADAEARTNLTA